MDPRIVDSAGYLLLTGTVLPLVISLIVRSRWSARTKSVVAAGVCFAGAAAVCWQAGVVEPTDILGAFVVVLTVTKALYDGFWRPTGIAPAIERATDVRARS